MPAHAWTHSPRSEALWLLANPQARTEGAVLPAGLDLRRALTAEGAPAQAQAWRLVQRGTALEVELEGASEPACSSGSPVVGRLLSRQAAAQAWEDRPGARPLSLPLAVGAALPLDGAGWRLRTDGEELVIAPLERLALAHTLGRDGLGLFVAFHDGHGDRRAYWCGPGQGQPEWLGPRARPSPSALGGFRIERGFFMDAAQFRLLGAEGLYPGRFGDTLRMDAHGLRGELRIAGIPVGFRWLWPGRFLMGSPVTEEGRYQNETQHEVILTRGFWLAETACTQALWQAVMGENPSGHRGRSSRSRR
jgi:hypothetical protein